MREAIYSALFCDIHREVVVGDECSITAETMLKTAEWLRLYSEKNNIPSNHVFVIACKARRDTIVLKTACYLNDFSFAALASETPSEKITCACSIVATNLILTDIQDAEFCLPNLERVFPDPEEIQQSKVFQLSNTASKSHSKYVVFTSGSTGDPKAVPIKFIKLERLIESFSKDYQITPLDKWAQFSGSGFDLSILDVFAPLFAGAVLVTLDRWLDRLHPYDVILRHGVTIWHSTPTALRHAPRTTKFLAASLRIVLFCGEPLSQQVLKICRKCFPNAQLYNHYGPAEATIYCTRINVTNWTESDGPIPIGHSIDGWSVYTASTCRKNPTEIYIESQFISEGYLNADSSEFNTILEGASKVIRYATGDFGYTKHGCLYFLSRADDQIKIDGHRIELSEISSVFSRITARPCVCIHVDSQLHLFVEAGQGDSKELLSSAKNWLVTAKLPKVHYIAHLPRNINDKVNRKQLEEIIRHRRG